jgi:hypothetical protein
MAKLPGLPDELPPCWPGLLCALRLLPRLPVAVLAAPFLALSDARGGSFAKSPAPPKTPRRK